MIDPRSALALLLLATACQPFEDAREEFDSIAGIEPDADWPSQVSYRHEVLRYPFLIRGMHHLGMGPVLRSAMSLDREIDTIDNPSGFARENLEVMVARSRGNLRETAITARRLLWVAELDVEQPLNQAVAVRGLEQALRLSGSSPVEMVLPDANVTTEARITSWLATLDAGWPTVRDSDTFDGDARRDYAAAIVGITERPHPSSEGQRALIGAFERLVVLERDDELKAIVRAGLVRALEHGLMMGLRRALFAGSPRVREAAIESIHALAGPTSVPVILAWIAKPPSVTSQGINRFDDDRYIRLNLVRMCGQLPEQLATQRHGDGPAPIEFLYETFFGDPVIGLRTIALEAMALCLGREVSLEPEWAERWWREVYVPNRGANS